MDSLYTPDSAVAGLLVLLGLTLLAAVGFLVAFTGATLLP